MPEGNRPNPPAHIGRFAVNGVFGDTPFTNVFWVRNGGASTPSPGDFDAFTHYVGSQWADRMTDLQSNQVGYASTEGLYYGPSGADLGSSQPIPQAGVMSGAVLPASVACVVSWRVAPHYKGGHPRSYLGGLTSEVLASVNTFTGSFTGSLAAAANNFLNDINAHAVGNFSDAHLGTVSFVLRKAWRTPPVFRDYVPGSATVDARIDSQRRRLGRDIA